MDGEMRLVTLVLSFLVMLVLTGMALTYVPAYVGQSRIYVQGAEDSTPEARPYQSYGYASAGSDTLGQGATASDPNRYYSQSEGWTYYTLPADGARQ
jgi:hypothetical protein